MPNTSPLINKKPVSVIEPPVSFCDAVYSIVEDTRLGATKLEWGNRNVFIAIREGRLQIKSYDSQWHDLILRDVDILGTDWVVFSQE